MKSSIRTFSLFIGIVWSVVPGIDAQVNVIQEHNNLSRDGLYIDAAFSPAAAAGLTRDLNFNGTISGNVYAQPLYIEGGPSGPMIIAVTESNNVYALNATTGTVIWQRNLGPPVTSGLPCGNINPVGITGTPVVDLVSRSLFLDAMIDGVTKKHFIYSLNVDTGATKPGWPVDVNATATYNGISFTSLVQNERGALALVNGRVYVSYSGHAGDCGDYHGWVVAVPVDRPSAPTAFETASIRSGDWTPGGVSSDGTSVFAVFGNGAGGTTWGHSEAAIRLGAGATFSGNARDYWAPPNWQRLDQADTDLAGPAMPLDLPGATPSALLVAFGKDGSLYLLARDSLGGIAAPLAQLQAAGGVILNTSAMYRTANGTYVVFRAHGVGGCPGFTAGSNLVAVKIAPGDPPQLSLAWCAGTGSAGSPIATTTDGTSNPIVWAVGAEGDQRLHGYDGDTGAVIFAGGGAGDGMASTSRFITPIVAKGRLFVAANGRLYAFTTR
jgi:outer membrane protein assembly factor BamB